MIRYSVLILILSFYFSPFTSAQKALDKSPNVKYAETITKEDISRHLHVIAADSMEGRKTGEIGQKKAAKYISEHFKNIGLKPPVKTEEGMSYYQEFQMVSQTWKEVYIKVGSEKFNFLKDVYVYGNSDFQQETQLDVVFAGKGNESDYASIKVEGKAVVLISEKAEEEAKAAFARKKGAKTVVFIKGKNQEEFIEAVDFNSYYLKRPIKQIKSPKPKDDTRFYISPRLAAKILNTTEDKLSSLNSASKLQIQKIAIKAATDEKIQFSSENVLGFLEGTDKKDEIVVITAHYDHIGKDGDVINNGADDDGSGTVSVMEMAEAFAKAKDEGHGPRRSILFMTVAGEEMGLFGSSFYTDTEPVFPLENTVVDLNIDMIGRIGGDYIAKNNPDYIYLIGSDKLSKELHELSEKVNKEYIHLKLDYKYNDENDPNRFYYRSDHYNFAKNNVPIIFYFNGVHADYHRPTDTVEKIHFPKMEKIARLVFLTAWEIANKETRLKVDKK